MKILFLTQVIPWPLDAGAKVRAYYTLRHLSKQHEITLVSFVRRGDEGAVRSLEPLCSGIYTTVMRRSRLLDLYHLLLSITRGKSFLIVRDRRNAMECLIRKVVSRDGPFDAIHADQLYMAPYALLAQRLCGDGSMTVLDQHNAVFRIPERLAVTESCRLKRFVMRAEARRLSRDEVRLCNSFDRVVWVTELDREALAGRGLVARRGARGTVIPIATEPPAVIPRRVEGSRRRVTFLGGLHWPPNAEGVSWFIDNVWPLVRGAAPDAVLTVVGKTTARSAKRDTGRGIEYTGHVGDVAPYLESTAVFVVPLLAGGGMRVKILEAWGRALPVVSTRIGAEGLKFDHGNNGLLADTPKSFASAVTAILTDPVLAMRLGNEGRKTVETFYDWRRTYAAWDEVYACASCSSFHTLRV